MSTAAPLAQAPTPAGATDTTTDAVLFAWAQRPLPDLLRHLVDHYHARLRAELPALVELARAVEDHHGDHPQSPLGLARHLDAMRGDVDSHLAKEEHVLFPLIAAGHGAHGGGPVRVMEVEHDDHLRALARMRALAGDLVLPVDACRSWRSLYARLAALEAELVEHIRLENESSFPRALRG